MAQEVADPFAWLQTEQGNSLRHAKKCIGLDARFVIIGECYSFFASLMISLLYASSLDMNIEWVGAKRQEDFVGE